MDEHDFSLRKMLLPLNAKGLKVACLMIGARVVKLFIVKEIKHST